MEIVLQGSEFPYADFCNHKNKVGYFCCHFDRSWNTVWCGDACMQMHEVTKFTDLILNKLLKKGYKNAEFFLQKYGVRGQNGWYSCFAETKDILYRITLQSGVDDRRYLFINVYM